MSKYGDLFLTGTPQSRPVPSNISTAKQVQNNAGGVVFSLDKWKRLERFLVLGSDSNTYYQKAPALTKQNAACVTECWAEDAARTHQIITDVSLTGRAPKNSPAIFAIALGIINANEHIRKAAYMSIPLVCRTSTHLFELVATAASLGKKAGAGRGYARALAKWYEDKTDDQLAYQLVKYRQREGWTHRDMLRVCHPAKKGISRQRSAMYDWLCGRLPSDASVIDTPTLIAAHNFIIHRTDTPENVKEVCRMIHEHNLPWEALPTWANSKPEVWAAMLETRSIPLTALIRNLGNMTRLGVFDNDELIDEACARLDDDRLLQKARIHPFNVLNALATYKSGKGFRGKNNWTPHELISNTLERTFYRSFSTIIPSGKRIMLAMDVSGSMGSNTLMNSQLTAREASVAMAMATLRSEECCIVTAFTSLGAHNMLNSYGNSSICHLPYMHPQASLGDIIAKTSRLPHAGTDCALPMLFAMSENLDIDAFVIYTDNETWAGNIAPVEALRRYREKSGIDAKLVVVGMTSTGFSIADPNDLGMLDVVGFDANAPRVISSFISDMHGIDQNNISAISETDEVNEGTEAEGEAD